MSGYENIEQRMKQVVAQHHATAPTFVWDNIEKTLDNKKDDRAAWIFFAIGLLLISAAIYAGFSYAGNASYKNAESSLVELKGKPSDTSKTAAILSQENEEEQPEAKENAEKQIDNHVTTQSTAKSLAKIEKSSADLKSIYAKESASQNSNSFDSVVENSSTSDGYVEKATFSQLILPAREMLDPISSIGQIEVELYKEREEEKLNNSVECPSFKQSVNLHVFVEGNIIGGRHFKSIGNGSNPSLAQARSDSERSWYTYGINAAAGIHLTPSIYAAAGIEWTQSKDKFYYEEESLVKMIITFDEQTGLPVDTSFVTGMLLNKGEIRYNSIDVPIFLGFIHNMGTWELGVEGGAVFNMSFGVNGKVFNDNNDISHTDNEPSIYKNKLGLGFKGAVVMRKYWKNGVSFQLKPSFKMYADDFQEASYPLPISMRFARLELGLRKDF